MAIKVEFDAWLNDVKSFDWGHVAKVAHDQRARNDSGEWETVGKDYLDVTITAEQLAAIDGASKVRVVGNLKAGTYQKQDGSTGVSLKVRAVDIFPIDRASQDPVGVIKSVLGASEDVPF
jgi:single-stranded DNA-binding protein